MVGFWMVVLMEVYICNLELGKLLNNAFYLWYRNDVITI